MDAILKVHINPSYKMGIVPPLSCILDISSDISIMNT